MTEVSADAPAPPPLPESPRRGLVRRGLALLAWADHPLRAGLVALAVYAGFALLHGAPGGVSPFPYYNYLADAFLHGQAHLRLEPSDTHDLSVVGDRLYLYWGPMPALLLLPLVALFGVRVSDVGFTVVLGAVDVLLVAVLLRAAVAARLVRLDRARRGALVACFALGTVHLTLAPFGRVWFTGQLVGFAALALAYLGAVRLRGASGALASGAALAAALATRSHLVLAGAWPAWLLLSRERGARWERKARLLVAGAAPVVATVLLLALYDQVRFGSPLENGLRFHRMGTGFLEDYARYGAFHLHYLPRNLFYQLVAYPLPFRPGSLQGGGLFWMTPPFLAAFWARGGPRGSLVALVASIVLTAVPILLVMGTGFVQWGPRYTLDFTVPLLLLTAVGLRRWLPSWVVGGLGLAVAMYAYGAVYLAAKL